MSFLSKKVSFTRVSYFLLILLLSVFLYSCGSSSDDDGGVDSIPLTSDSPDITSKDGALEVIWTKAVPIQDIDATYEVWIGTDPGNTEKVAEGGEADDAVDNADGITVIGNFISCTVSALADGTPLVNGTTYYVRLKFLYAGIGESDLGEYKEGVPVGVPAAPASVSSEAGWDGILSVSWTASEFASNYNVYWLKDGTTDTPSSDASAKTFYGTEALITGVDNDAQYRVWIQAVNTAGSSDYVITAASATAAAQAPAAPAAPVLEASSQTLTVSWTAVDLASEYTVSYSTADDISTADSITAAPAAGTVSTRINGLTNGTVYYVWVQASNTSGSSAYSGSASATVASIAETAPINFSDMSFVLGEATAEYIWAEKVPESLFFPDGRFSDRLSRIKETAVANLVCDAAAWYVRTNYEDVDFTFLNSGYVEGPISKGDVTVGTVLKMVSEDSREDTLVVLSLTGAQVTDLFRTAAAVIHTGRGSRGTSAWAVVSEDINYTIRYKTLDAALTELPEDDSEYTHGWIADGTLKFNGEDIDPSRTYRVLTTSYLADGQEGYTVLLGGTDRSEYDSVYFWQAVEGYIYEMGTVTPYLDGRIHLIGGVPLSAPGWEAGDVSWTAPYDNTSYFE